MIDLRSDTVTKPTEEMRQAMAQAEVGDDVYGDDPTVNKLQALAAEKLGFESALFTCSGTQANFIALISHCQRGDEYICGQQAHSYIYEGGGAAVFGSIQPQPIEFEADGSLAIDKISQKIKPDDIHCTRTKLVCLENTHSGKVLGLDYLKDVSNFAQEKKLAMHLDGARVFNASVKLGVDVKEISRHFDSVSVCLSKGLGAPIGSVLCGSKDFITEAARWRKVAGGGMRQAGIIAAAGIIAVSKEVQRLEDDHHNAEILAKGLAEIPQINIDMNQVQTNMVFAELTMNNVQQLADYLKQNNILINASNPIRLVTHKDVSSEDMRQVIEVIKGYFS